MRRTVSRKTKLKQKRGLGHGKNYRPWIKAREVPSTGTTSNIVDWKTGRVIELLSQGESMLYYLLRFDDNNTDVREQFPLDLDSTNAIASQLGIMPVNNGRDNMTTDLLVTHRDGSMSAYSLKSSRSELDNPRTVEKLFVEMTYWQLRKVAFHLVFKDELNACLAANIRLSVEYYSPETVNCKASLLKHLVATKQIELDMESGILHFGELVQRTEIRAILEQKMEEMPWLQ